MSAYVLVSLSIVFYRMLSPLTYSFPLSVLPRYPTFPPFPSLPLHLLLSHPPSLPPSLLPSLSFTTSHTFTVSILFQLPLWSYSSQY